MVPAATVGHVESSALYYFSLFLWYAKQQVCTKIINDFGLLFTCLLLLIVAVSRFRFFLLVFARSTVLSFITEIWHPLAIVHPSNRGLGLYKSRVVRLLDADSFCADDGQHSAGPDYSMAMWKQLCKKCANGAVAMRIDLEEKDARIVFKTLAKAWHRTRSMMNPPFLDLVILSTR